MRTTKMKTKMNSRTCEIMKQLQEGLLVEGDPTKRARLKALQLMLNAMTDEFDAEVLWHDNKDIVPIPF